MVLGLCPFFSTADTDYRCKGVGCELAIIEDDKFKCCAFVEIANKGKKPEEQTTNK